MSEWTDIGEQLRKARENMDLELMDVAHSTRIPLATLKALEESDYSVFPSPTYARSFLSQYSDFLKVDAHEWVDAFETGDVLSNVNDHGYLQAHSEHIGGNDPEPTKGKRSQSSSHREEKPSSGGSSLLQTFTVFFVTALLIGGGIYAYQKYAPTLSGETDSDTAELADSTEDEKNTLEKKPASPPVEDPESAKPVVVKNDPAPDKAIVVASDPPASETPSSPSAETVVPAPPKPRSGPPPKALVIEEEDE